MIVIIISGLLISMNREKIIVGISLEFKVLNCNWEFRCMKKKINRKFCILVRCVFIVFWQDVDVREKLVRKVFIFLLKFIMLFNVVVDVFQVMVKISINFGDLVRRCIRLGNRQCIVRVISSNVVVSLLIIDSISSLVVLVFMFWDVFRLFIIIIVSIIVMFWIIRKFMVIWLCKELILCLLDNNLMIIMVFEKVSVIVIQVVLIQLNFSINLSLNFNMMVKVSCFSLVVRVISFKC